MPTITSEHTRNRSAAARGSLRTARRRDIALFAAVSAAGLAGDLAAGPACAQGLLPAYGTDVRVGDLRTQFARVFDTNPPVASDRTFLFQPTLDITETYDSAGATNRAGRYAKDYITQVTPGILVTATAARLNGTLSYDPSFRFYALHGDESGVTHNLNADVTATIIEDSLFFDLRGYATTQPILGGFNQGGGKQNEVQTESFSLGPRFQHRFGDSATMQVGYTFTRTLMNTDAAGFGGLNSNYNSQQESASLASGPDFGRIQAVLSAQALQYDGTGIYRGAHNEVFSLSTAYAFTRMITVTSSVGHETIVYGPGGPRPIDDITWSGGFRLVPNADSLINVSYGHQQGGTSWSLDGSYAPTTRTRLLARYSQGVGTALQNLQNALAGTTVGPGGVLVDTTTHAPVQLGNYLGQQAGVYRTTTASLSATLLLDRDTVSLSVDQTDRVQLSGGGGPGFGTNSGLNVVLAWQHQLSEALSVSPTLQYGIRSFPGTGTNSTVALSLAVTYAISQSLSTNLLMSHSDTSGNNFGQPPTHDLVVVGLHKAF